MDKKKIALIIDTEGWAFDNIAHQIKKNLSEYFNIDIIPGRLFEGNMARLFVFCKEYDLIHFLWRGYISLIDKEETKKHVEEYYGMSYEEFKKEYIYSKKISFAICDHLYLRGEEAWRTDVIMRYTPHYMVTSNKLLEIYNKKENKPEAVIHDGVDLTKYFPQNLERFNENIEKIIAGWVGNSKFKDSDNDDDMKGVEGIIKPAIAELKEEGYNIELELADRNIKMIPQEEMPKFYNKISVYICASKEEGTPLTILESMAMGIPVITTDVGVAREALGELEKKYIMEERSKECLKNKIKLLFENKKELSAISKENMEQVKKFDWTIVCKQYKDFFENILKQG